MKNRFNVVILFACVVLWLTGCGPLKQTSTYNDSKQTEEENTKTDTESAEEKVDESETKDTEVPVQNDSEDMLSDAVHAYAEYIEENDESFNTPFGTVGLIHIDDDEIPELAYSLGTSHASGVIFYSYDGRSVTELGAYGSLGTACYEYRKGTVYGYYTGMGSTYDNAAIINNGKIENEYRVVITDIELANPASDESGFKYAITDKDFNETEITREEYESIISPFLIENRDYKILANDYLMPLHEMDNIEEALLQSLEFEDGYPKMSEDYQDSEYFSSRITPED